MIIVGDLVYFLTLYGWILDIEFSAVLLTLFMSICYNNINIQFKSVKLYWFFLVVCIHLKKNKNKIIKRLYII